jgi:ABC-type glycerol-3-phosphate transport system substrate-binding protein
MKGWGGQMTKGDRTNFSDPKVVEGVTQLMDFAAKYTPWFAPPPSDPFLAGQAAMEWAQRPVLYGCCTTPDRKKWTSSFVPRFVNFPLLPTPEIGAGMAGWGASIDTKYPHEAAAFLMYSLSKEGQLIYSKAAGEVPVRSDLTGSSVWRDQIPQGGSLDQKAFVDYTQYQSYPPTNLPIASDAQIAEAITNMFDEIRLGRASPKAALKSADKAVNAALKSEQQ